MSSKHGVGGVLSTSGKELSLTILKANRLLRVVSEARHGVSFTEIVSTSGLPMTVCHRLLGTLEHERFVEKDRSTGRYRLGIGLIALAGKALQSHPTSARALDLISEVVTVSQDVGLLMVEDRGEALCLSRVDGSYPLNVVGSQVGSRLPLHCGGAPFAILAFSSDDYVEQYLSRQLEKRSSRCITNPDQIRVRVAEARRRGYTVGDEDLFDYVVAVGVPIYEPDGRLFGAVSLGGIKQRYDENRIHEIGTLLSTTAQRYFTNQS